MSRPGLLEINLLICVENMENSQKLRVVRLDDVSS